MSIWGKIIGGTVGFIAMGGPLGAILGMAAGHLLDQSLKARATPAADGQAPPLGREEKQVAFTVAVVALAAKLAKADGQVTRDEVATLKRVFQLPDEAAPEVARIFNRVRTSPEGFEPYAHQIAALLRGRKQVLEDLLGALLMIAHADGVYHPAERAYIAEVARIFGFSEAELRRIESTFLTARTAEEDDPYEVLDIAADAPDEAVKAAYRKLLRENHPDRLIAQGLPEEFVEVANRKMARINAAWDRIKAARNLT